MIEEDGVTTHGHFLRTTMFKNNRAKLAKLFMLVILIGLFFRQWTVVYTFL